MSYQAIGNIIDGALISHVWLFQGAEGGKWVEEIKERYSGSEQATPQSVVQHSERGGKKPRIT